MAFICIDEIIFFLNERQSACTSECMSEHYKYLHMHMHFKRKHIKQTKVCLFSMWDVVMSQQIMNTQREKNVQLSSPTLTTFAKKQHKSFVLFRNLYAKFQLHSNAFIWN